jgi:hypothetical protein
MNPNSFDVIYNEITQPLTTMTSLIELWERGLVEPDDLEMMKQELTRINAALKELKALYVK